MEKKHITIHDFDFTVIADFFKDMDRQGPGDSTITETALKLIGNLPEAANIADIGCGTGGQTIFLARNLTGHITASDIMPEFVDTLKQKVLELNLQDKIMVKQESMDKLSLKENELDLIWAEGSIYNIGYQRGLNEWKKYLKPNGYIAVSEATWFTEERPEEIETFWYESYAEIDTIPNKVMQMQQAGYIPVAHFRLPQFCWWNYFNAGLKIIEPFLKKNNQSKAAQSMVEHFNKEIRLYEKYKDYYGYVFYIGQLPETNLKVQGYEQ